MAGRTDNYSIECATFLALFLPILGIVVFVSIDDIILAVAAVLAFAGIGVFGSERVEALQSQHREVVVGSVVGCLLFGAWVVYWVRTYLP